MDNADAELRVHAGRRNRALFLTGLASAAAGALLVVTIGLSVALARERAAARGEGPKRMELQSFSIELPVLKHTDTNSAKGHRRLKAHHQFWQQYTRWAALKGTHFPSKVPISEKADTIWIGEVSIGHPEQRLNVIFDTGLPHFLLPSQQCRHCGDTHAPVGKEALYLANESHMLQLPHVALFLASETVSFKGSVQLGVFGLGLPGDTDPRTDGALHTPLTALIEAYGHRFADNVFSFRLSSGNFTHPVNDLQRGSLLVGAVPDVYPMGINWVDVLPEQDGSYGNWRLKIDQVTIGSGESFYGRAGIVDLSTSCIVMPSSEASIFFSQVSVARHKDSRCSALPPIKLQLGGQDYVLEGDDYAVQFPGRCEVCVLADPRDHEWILGDVFHAKYHVTYNFGSYRVGLPKGKVSKTSRLFSMCAVAVAVVFITLLVPVWSLKRRGHLVSLGLSSAFIWPMVNRLVPVRGAAGDAAQTQAEQPTGQATEQFNIGTPPTPDSQVLMLNSSP